MLRNWSLFLSHNCCEGPPPEPPLCPNTGLSCSHMVPGPGGVFHGSDPVVQDRPTLGLGVFSKCAPVCKGGATRGEALPPGAIDSSYLSLRLTWMGSRLSPQVIRLRLWFCGRVFWVVMDLQGELLIYILKAYSGRDGFNPAECVSIKERLSNLDRERYEGRGSSSEAFHIGAFLHLLYFQAEETWRINWATSRQTLRASRTQHICT